MTKNGIFKKLHIICSIVITITMSNIFGALEDTWHFNTEELKKITKVREKLTQATDNNNTKNKDLFIQTYITPAVELPIPQQNGEIIKTIMSTQEARQIQNQIQDQIKNMSPEKLQQIQPQIEKIGAELAQQNKIIEKSEKIKIASLFLDRGPQARATIIFTPGFCPGYKESFAPFVKLAPKDCNLLFLELRNHGESTGKSFCSNVTSFLTPGSCAQEVPCPSIGGCGTPASLKNIGLVLGAKDYGKHEHKDILGAIMNVSKKTQGKPIILFGWCAGAFLSARTLVRAKQLQPFDKAQGREDNFLKQYNIQGLIFDSGFVSLKTMMENTKNHKDHKMLPDCLSSIGKKINGIVDSIADLFSKVPVFKHTAAGLSIVTNLLFPKEKEDVPESLIYGVTKPVTSVLLWVLKKFLGKQVEKHDPKTRIDDKIHLLENLPVLYIHSKQDHFAPFDDIQKLHEKTTKSELWATEGDYHAKNHLKYKDKYKKRLHDWLNKNIDETKRATNIDTENKKDQEETKTSNTPKKENNTKESSNSGKLGKLPNVGSVKKPASFSRPLGNNNKNNVKKKPSGSSGSGPGSRSRSPYSASKNHYPSNNSNNYGPYDQDSGHNSYNSPYSGDYGNSGNSYDDSSWSGGGYPGHADNNNQNVNQEYTVTVHDFENIDQNHENDPYMQDKPDNKTHPHIKNWQLTKPKH